MLSPHRTVERGWTSVDVVSGDASQEKFAGGALGPSLPALAALAVARDLEGVVLENVLEVAPVAEQVPLLEAAARALAPGGMLQALVAGPVAEGPADFVRAANRRLHLEAAAVRSLAGSAGLRGFEVLSEGGVLELGDSRRRVPHAHTLLRWRR